MGQSKAESFTAYLEEKQRLEKQRSAPAAGGSALALLSELAAAPGRQLTLPELQAASGMSFVDFSQALKRLADSGYLTVSGQPGRESAQLTNLGADVADLVRSK